MYAHKLEIPEERLEGGKGEGGGGGEREGDANQDFFGVSKLWFPCSRTWINYGSKFLNSVNTEDIKTQNFVLHWSSLFLNILLFYLSFQLF